MQSKAHVRDLTGLRFVAVAGSPLNAALGWALLAATVPLSVFFFKFFETPARRALQPKRRAQCIT
jgi:peptidoglycan/LPS O-acetylase OafA/YrhL